MPKKKREEAKSTPSKKVSLEAQIEVSEEMFKRLERDLKRGTFNVLTPYTLAQAYNIRISTARKLLREAVKKKILILYSGGKTPVYVSVKKRH